MLGGGWVVNHIEIMCMVKRRLLRGFSLYTSTPGLSLLMSNVARVKMEET
jgi:hypothetical protein